MLKTNLFPRRQRRLLIPKFSRLLSWVLTPGYGCIVVSKCKIVMRGQNN